MPRTGAAAFFDIEITARLRNDVIALLGELRAAKSAPLLVEIMENRIMDNLFEKMRPEMTALANIGAAAVPYLISSIETAKQKALSVQFPDPRTDEERTRYVMTQTARTQLRAAMVLGEIGDPRGLPVLQRLLEPTSDLNLVRPETVVVKHAIKQIQDRAK
ncbi:MAG TPA: hypothetical protein VGV87_09685 [Blastocatellia bacterium]|nr:hypothetical protein [Blastocatellia bacterium]